MQNRCEELPYILPPHGIITLAFFISLSPSLSLPVKIFLKHSRVSWKECSYVSDSHVPTVQLSTLYPVFISWALQKCQAHERQRLRYRVLVECQEDYIQKWLTQLHANKCRVHWLWKLHRGVWHPQGVCEWKMLKLIFAFDPDGCHRKPVCSLRNPTFLFYF